MPKRPVDSSQNVSKSSNVTQVGEGINMVQKVEQPPPEPSLRNALFLPAATVAGQQIKAGTEKVINNFLQWKKNENVREHLERAEQNGRFQDESEQQRSIEDISLFGEWVDGISDIEPTDELLSMIWHKWLQELEESNRKDDLGLVLTKMRTLEPREAELLLEIANLTESNKKSTGVIQRFGSIRSKSIFADSTDFADQDIHRLQKMSSDEIVQLDLDRFRFDTAKYCLWLGYYTLFMAICSLFTFSVVWNSTFFDTFRRFGFYGLTTNTAVWLVLLLSFAVPILYFILFQPTRKKRAIKNAKYYRLTWIGEKIVSYSKR